MTSPLIEYLNIILYVDSALSFLASLPFILCVLLQILLQDLFLAVLISLGHLRQEKMCGIHAERLIFLVKHLLGEFGKLEGHGARLEKAFPVFLSNSVHHWIVQSFNGDSRFFNFYYFKTTVKHMIMLSCVSFPSFILIYRCFWGNLLFRDIGYGSSAICAGIAWLQSM